MSRGFLVLAQNSQSNDADLKPVHLYEKAYENVFVDVWYKELTHVKGQHVYYDKKVYKVTETYLPGTEFDLNKHQLLVENVKLIGDNNKELEFHCANKGDIVLDMNHLYSVVTVDSNSPYTITKLYDDFFVEIWHSGQKYNKGQHVWYNNSVYTIQKVTSEIQFDLIEKKLILENIYLFADNDTSVVCVDPRKSATVLHYNSICSIVPNTIEDYVQQACILAKTLKRHCPDENISIITNDEISPVDRKLFDHVLPIPFADDAENSTWKVENRWKMYECTPYLQTIVMDTDMLILEDISRWWNYLDRYDLFFTSTVKTYRNEEVIGDAYRKVFTANSLPNIYTGLHYFRKSKTAETFYNMLEVICKNWNQFYNEFLPHNTPSSVSIDVSAALAVLLLDTEHEVTNNSLPISFVHMKPNIQNWKKFAASWQNSVPPYINSAGELKIGNMLQNGVFHYTENNFVETSGIENLYDRA